MKKILLLCFILVASIVPAQVTLSPVSQNTITPTGNDTIGAFCRVFHHPSRNKFYIVYASRHYSASLPQGMLQDFRWREYSSSFTYTGNEGLLPGFSDAGDFAMVMVDSTYFHLTNQGSTTSGQLKYRLTKLDDDFNFVDSTVIQLNAHDSNIDQLLNYTNGRLIIGAMHDSCCSPPTTPPQPSYDPNINLYQYDLNLNAVASPKVLQPKSYSWGASAIHDGSNYYIVTFDNFSSHILSAYRYDNNFNYLSSVQLTADGQWSQGVISDGTYYYVAYHNGDHNHGNVKIGVYDTNWNLIATQNVTNNLYSAGLNAQRPFLCKNGNMLYVSYDLETYNTSSGINNKDWQAHVDIFQVNISMDVQEKNQTTGSFNIVPNPAQATTQIITENFPEGNKKYELVTVTGSLARSGTFNGNTEIISLEQLPAGFYMMRVTAADQSFVIQPFIIR